MRHASIPFKPLCDWTVCTANACNSSKSLFFTTSESRRTVAHTNLELGTSSKPKPGHAIDPSTDLLMSKNIFAKKSIAVATPTPLRLQLGALVRESVGSPTGNRSFLPGECNLRVWNGEIPLGSHFET